MPPSGTIPPDCSSSNAVQHVLIASFPSVECLTSLSPVPLEMASEDAGMQPSYKSFHLFIWFLKFSYAETKLIVLLLATAV